MIKRRLRRFQIAMLAVIAVGCASAGGMHSDPLDAGEVKFYSAPLNTVAPAARQAVLALATNITAQGDWSGKIYEQLDHILAPH